MLLKSKTETRTIFIVELSSNEMNLIISALDNAIKDIN